jgi:hypothetical protein
MNQTNFQITDKCCLVIINTMSSKSSSFSSKVSSKMSFAVEPQNKYLRTDKDPLLFFPSWPTIKRRPLRESLHKFCREYKRPRNLQTAKTRHKTKRLLLKKTPTNLIQKNLDDTLVLVIFFSINNVFFSFIYIYI